MYKACIEEGTLYGVYKFLRYYFKGTTTYNGSIVYEWEVIFFDTGDILIHGITIPSVSGNYYIQGAKKYSYTAPSVENPYVTFYSQDENNSTFSVEYDIIRLDDLQLLAQDTNNVIYTVENNALVSIGALSVTSELLKTYGVHIEDIQPLLTQIPDVKVYVWSDKTTVMPRGLCVHAIPQNQVIYSDNMYRPQLGTYVTVLGIENVTVEYEGSPLIAVSFDGGTTWNAFKNSKWVHLEQENSGNTPTEIVSISTPEWNSKFDVTRQIRFRFTLTEGDSITNLIVHYLNPAE